MVMKLFLIKSLAALFLSLVFTAYIIPILRKLAFKFKILDIPNGTIKVHKEPVPYLGGLGIYFGFIVTLGLILPFENKIFFFIIGSTILLLVGLFDDLIVMSPIQKFFGQMIAAFCFLKGGFYLKQGFFENNYWGMPISFLWILVIINAFNLIDIMDGLATTVACCATFSFAIIALWLGNFNLLILLLAFLGSLLAFLFYNKPEARIYMGDAGALFIGGFMAIIPFFFDWATYNKYGFLTPVVILAIPLIEVGTLIIIRTYKRIPFYMGSPDHFAIYLRKKGWSKIKVLYFSLIQSFILFFAAFLFFLNIISMFFLIAFVALYLLTWYVILFF